MKNARTTSILALAVLWLGSASRTYADKTDFLVNDNGTNVDQSQPRIAVAPHKGFLIVWSDNRSGQSDIYMQRFDTSGTKIGQNARVNDDTGTVHQAGPAIGVDYSSRFDIVWQDYRNGSYPFNPDVYLQAYDSGVVAVNSNRNLTTIRPDSFKEYPDIDLGASGNGVVVWADYRNRNWDIYGQRVTAAGTPIGSNFKINDDVGTSQQHAPRVSVAPAGWFVVTWYDNRTGSDDIYVQRFDSSGQKLGYNLKANSDVGSYRQAFPDIAVSDNAHFGVVWVDWRNGVYPANPDIYARRFDTSMTPMAAEIKVNSDGTSRAQKEPSIAADRMGNVAMIWSDSTSTSWDIAGQMLDASGRIRESNFIANFQRDSAQQQPDIALDGRYRYVTWMDRRSGHYDIYASITKYNDPKLIADPLAIQFEMVPSGTLPSPQRLTVSHGGYNPLSYQVICSQSWFTVTPTSGTTPDTLLVSVADGSLAVGTYTGSITLVDRTDNDSSMFVSVTLTVANDSAVATDTILMDSVETVPGVSTPMPVDMSLIKSAESIELPLAYDTALIRIDSFRFDPGLAGNLTKTCLVDSTRGRMALHVQAAMGDSIVAPVTARIGEIFFSALKPNITTTFDTLSFDTFTTIAISPGGSWLIPKVIPGVIIVSAQTGINDPRGDTGPNSFTLSQNYPNPFNGATVIKYTLPRSSKVQLEVFNILGQRVRTLVWGMVTAGYHTAYWDGDTEDGRAAPSGIYFYRLQGESVSLVQKMILAK